MNHYKFHMTVKYQIIFGLCYFLTPGIAHTCPKEEKPLITKLGQNDYDEANWNCSYPLINICQTMKKAIECNAIPYCTQCIWSTTFLFTGIASLKCKRCLSEVVTAEANFTDEGNYTKSLRPLCDLHILIDDQQACLQNIDFYLSNKDVFWSVDPLNISTLDTCSLLGMCYSPFKVTLPPETATDLLIGEYWKEAKNFILNEEMRDVYGAKVTQIIDEVDTPAFFPVFNPNMKTGKVSKYSCQFIEINGPSRLNFKRGLLISFGCIVGLITITFFEIPGLIPILYYDLKNIFSPPAPIQANANVVNPIAQAG